MVLKVNATKHSGMTLIEVLISLVIFAVGMLGLGSLLMVAHQSNNSSYAKQQAVQCIYNIFDRMRANSKAAIAGNYNASNINSSGSPTAPSTPAVLCSSSVCTPTQLAAYDLWYWLSSDVTKLPNGSGSVATSLSGAAGNTLITVTVQWDDSIAQNNGGASSKTSAVNPNMVQLSMQSQL